MPPDPGPDVSDSAPLQHVDFSTQPNDFELGQGYVLRVLPGGDVDLFHARGGVRIPWATFIGAVTHAQALHDAALRPIERLMAPPARRDPVEGDHVLFFGVARVAGEGIGEGGEFPPAENAKVTVVHGPSIVNLALVDREGSPEITSIVRGGEGVARPFWDFPPEP
jgi:hypothetical protein